MVTWRSPRFRAAPRLRRSALETTATSSIEGSGVAEALSTTTTRRFARLGADARDGVLQELHIRLVPRRDHDGRAGLALARLRGSRAARAPRRIAGQLGEVTGILAVEPGVRFEPISGAAHSHDDVAVGSGRGMPRLHDERPLEARAPRDAQHPLDGAPSRSRRGHGRQLRRGVHATPAEVSAGVPAGRQSP